MKKAGLGTVTMGLAGCNNTRLVSSEKQEVPDFTEYNDGKKDASSVIQQVVDAGIGDIYFPKGIYRITKTITIDLNSVGVTSIFGNGTARILMEGKGPAFRFIGTHEGTANPSTVKDDVWKHQRSPMVDGIEIVGAHKEAIGIQAEGTIQFTVTRTSIRSAFHAVHLIKRNRNVVISECHFYDNRGIGIFLDNLNLHQINIVNCHISYNSKGGVVSKGTELRNLQIGSCDIEGNMGDAESNVAANIYIESRKGSCGEIAIMGCTIQHTHEAPDSTNIFIDGKVAAQSNTRQHKDGNITIVGNVMSDANMNIDLQNARGVVITGNTIWMGYNYNLRVHCCENFIVSDNMFDRNPVYHSSRRDNWNLAVLFSDCDGGIISGNHIRGAGEIESAVTIRDSRHMNVANCNILDFGRQGLLLENVSDSKVSDCIIRENRAEWREEAIAIRWKSGRDNMITNNLFGNSFSVDDTIGHMNGNIEKSM
ncbi:Right handed beta helix region [Fodinibius roseus]|uniref:Right handed beta helix region n=2 Tax=Fodinibius roseus TaxID=1194090 RepID=A0A1M5DQD8_9BACT|nr:Right handed beta helix region [Fodinibius roseus]